MKAFMNLLCCLASIASGQTTLDQAPAANEQAGGTTAQTSPDQISTQTSQNAGGAQTSQTSAQQQNQSALGISPGTEAIKEKDLYEQSGYLHPFWRMPKFVLGDERRIWTSPFHTSHNNIKWWGIFGGATAALIAADQHLEKAAPTNSTLVHLGNDVSYLGTAYTLIPIAGTFYLIGSAAHKERFRETGLLSFETLVDATVVQEAIKSITDRQRPSEGQGEGHFFTSATPTITPAFRRVTLSKPLR